MKSIYLTILLLMIFKMSFSLGFISHEDTLSKIDAISFWEDSLKESLESSNVLRVYKSGSQQHNFYAISLNDVSDFKNQNKESNNKISLYSCTKTDAKWVKMLLYADSALRDYQVGERVINLVDDFTNFHDIDADLENDPFLVYSVSGLGGSEIQGVTIFVINRNKSEMIQNWVLPKDSRRSLLVDPLYYTFSAAVQKYVLDQMETMSVQQIMRLPKGWKKAMNRKRKMLNVKY